MGRCSISPLIPYLRAVPLGFNIYYGAAEDEIRAIAALGSVGAEAYSLGQTATDPASGTPNTFIFAFSAVGGEPIFPQCVLEPMMATNRLGDRHNLKVFLTDEGSPITGATVDFDVVSGPHVGTTGSKTTNSDGEAIFSYYGSSHGRDIIEATGTVNGEPFECRAIKRWYDFPACTDRDLMIHTGQDANADGRDDNWMVDSGSGFVPATIVAARIRVGADF